MKIIFSPKYTINIKHKFKTIKFQKTIELLLKNKIIKNSEILEPKIPEKKYLLLAHSQKWVNKLFNLNFSKNDILKAEMPINRNIVYVHLLHAGGTVLASEIALKEGIGIHCGGGGHHAHRDFGAGFCLVNDIAVAIKKLFYEGKIKKALVVDLDVHQGDGTAEIFKNEKNVFTFSIHQKDIYPLKKEKSSLDIELRAKTNGKKYLEILSEIYPKIVDKFCPDIIFYNAGADVYKKDLLGGFNLNMKDISKRDEIVFSLAKNKKIPVVLTLSGGYARNINDTAKIHYNTIKKAIEIFYQSGNLVKC